MKKKLIILSLVLIVGLTASIAYAQVPKILPRTNVDYEQWDDWYKERMEWRKSQLNQAVEDKEITEEDAKTWNDHFDYMEEFHREYGPMPGGGCFRGGYGWNNGNGFRNGYGPGMMRGYRWNR
ncbi:conserved exported hypothetical protein [[Clostridium] ultunense Esp]|uniref:DUF2680 domain-containing protein n=1 Tax=[Clostridium] ultunense Esp TaxID=1288971 RepID=M1Z5C2_9FIRM|nr:hypothetical protein [Schnuerera ultunensis]CCQ92723.1 conserved exported hypothetical protein [[Clostridium] ultunense Esp]SHD77850.1 conserved exported protein of unknown function [[Clostridium] ultunense Esp]